MSKNKPFKTFKVKRSKSRLYKKRKSTGRKVLEIVLMVLIVGVLGVVGYSAAGPLISYFQGDGEGSTTTPWEPPESSTPEESDTTTSSSSESVDTTQPVSGGKGAYVLTEAALTNQASLSSALESAKQAGCSVIIVTLKDVEGHLLYKSELADVKDTEIVTGTMTAQQIVSVIKGKGFTEVKALTPTLYDRLAPVYVDDMCYRFAAGGVQWLDGAPDKGGKRWADPFLDGTKDYYKRLTKELTDAGFDEVLLSELRFPNFMPYDRSLLEKRNFDDNRYTALTAVYKAAGSKAAAAVNMKDVLAGYGESWGSTAEILADKSFTGTVYLMIDLTDFGTTLATGENTNISLPADPAQKVQVLVSRAADYIGTNVTVIPVIGTKGLSVEALGKCYEALDA
ncbi:MAG: hypothetical protein J1F60_09650 [Oscillospiraceae bacterium]|nr:hypothetical protein [Oscillospiraceae bacterium]